MSHSDFLADPEALRDRAEWLVHIYLVDPDGVVTILRYCRDNQGRGIAPTTALTVGSTTIPIHAPYRKRLIQPPTITQSMWQPGTILGHSFPTFGEMIFRNRDGGLDRYRPVEGYKWGGRVEVFFGDWYNFSTTLGSVFDGRSGHPAFSLSQMKVPLLGRESDFNVPTSTRVYRGTGYGLELSGVRVVNYGSPAAVNITGSLTVERWIWIDTAPNADTNIWGWMLGGFAPWVIRITSTRALQFRCHVAGVAESTTSTAVLGVQKPYHIAVTVSGRDVTFYIWDEDAQTLTKEVQTNAISSATRSSNSGGSYIMQSANVMVDWWDESRVWNVARTEAEIAADRHRPFEAGSIPATLVHRTAMDDGAGTTVTDSSATAANGTISGAGTSTWLWMMEGGPELAGKPRPDVWGKRFGVAPVLVSPIHQVYQVAGGGAVQSIAPTEGGNPQTTAAAATAMRDFIVTSVAAGNFRNYLARGMFRFGSAPTLPISCTVEGYNGGSLGYVSTAGPITRDIITRRGRKIPDPSEIDTASFTAYGTAAPATMGIAIYSPNTDKEYISPVLDMVNVGGMGWWGFVGSSILFHIERFTGPDTTADYNLSTAIIDVEEVYPPPPVIYEVIVKYHKNDVVMTEDQLAQVVVIGTVNWTQWTLPWLEKKATDDALRDAYAGSSGMSLVLETGLYNDADAQTLADTALSVLSGVREILIVTLRPVGLEIRIGMTVTLTFQYQDGTQRLGLDGTAKYLVINTEILFASGQIKITVWR